MVKTLAPGGTLVPVMCSDCGMMVYNYLRVGEEDNPKFHLPRFSNPNEIDDETFDNMCSTCRFCGADWVYCNGDSWLDTQKLILYSRSAYRKAYWPS